MSKIIYVALIAAFAHGDPNTKVIKQIERFNRKLKATPAEGCVDCKVGVAGQEESHRLQCLKAICPRGFGQLDEQMQAAGKKMLEHPDVEFQTELRDAIKAILNARLEDVKDLRRAIASNATFKDPSAKRLIRYAQIQRKTADPKQKGYSRDDMAVLSALNEIEGSVASNYLLEEEFDFLSGEATPEQITDVAKTARDQIQAARVKIAAKTGAPTDSPTDAGVDAAIKAGKITSIVYSRLRAELRQAQMTDRLLASDAFDPPPGDQSMKKLFGAEDAKLARLESLLTKYVAHKPGAPLGRDEIGRLIDSNSRRCVGANIANGHFAPTPEQIAKFSTEVPRIGQQFVQSLKPHLSAKSSAALESAAAKWIPAIPGTGPELRAQFLQDVRTLKMESEKAHDVREKTSKANPEFSLAQQSTLIGSFLDMIGSTLDELCSRNEVQPVRDAAYVGLDQFKVGPMSLTNPEFGNAVLRHEFGHLVSGYFRKENANAQAPFMSETSTAWFNKVRECLGKIPGHEKRVEEDWADFTSDLVATAPSACYIMSANRESFTVQDAKDADHSSELFRILQHRYREGLTVPEPCQRVLKRKGEAYAGACKAEGHGGLAVK